MVENDPELLGLLADYETAVEDFGRVSRTLTAALLSLRPADDVQTLLAAEARTRDVIALTRIRLANRWHTSHVD